ncbi:MAG: DAK2 domain-containing protein [Anaerolineae bacterium]|nr:DAK2 domain-containing protein [Anaerolineae bacterium]
MVVEVSRRVCDGIKLKYLFAAGLAWLEHNRERVNQLNVYPVPDGDTGTNMTLTMRKAYGAVADWDDANVGKVAEAVAKGALLGARGNSGVILSQILRGFANGLKDREVFDGGTFAYCCKLAAESAYRAVEKPVEGTILSVAKAAAEAAFRVSQEENDLQVILEVTLATARDALRRTPEQLEVLRKAGVVDSGGQGLVYIFEGMTRMLQGEPVMLHETLMSSHTVDGDTHDGTWQDELEPEDEEGYGYDVQFLMRGQSFDVSKVRRDFESMGWSTLVVGDETLIKVHIHVHNPADPIGYAIDAGAALDDIVVENMQLQYEAQAAKRVKKDLDDAPVVVEGVAVITVAAGDGLRRLMVKELGASVVVSGGQTMNPSAEDFLSAINAIGNSEIIILPNNKNIVMAAEQAAKLSVTKNVRVVPSRTIPQGVSALFAYMNTKEGTDLEGIFGAMRAAIASVRSAEITTSTKTITLDGISAQEGQVIGLLDGKLSAAGDTIDGVVETVLGKGEAHNADLITLYFGDVVREPQANRLAETLRNKFPGPEVQVVRGGQPLYPYLISIE